MEMVGAVWDEGRSILFVGTPPASCILVGRCIGSISAVEPGVNVTIGRLGAVSMVPVAVAVTVAVTVAMTVSIARIATVSIAASGAIASMSMAVALNINSIGC